MKSNQLITLMYLLTIGIALAQNPLSQKTQVEVSTGIVLPFFGSGKELMRAKELRDNGLSNYQNAAGIRTNVGKYTRQQGWNLIIAFYKPIRKVNGLMIGSVVRSAQTGSTPENGGYSEGYYFNFLTAGLAAKYYLFTKNNIYLKGDFGMGSVFTKNRFVNSSGEQNFFHQFGIGTGGSIGAGYSITPFKNKDVAIDLSTVYQFLNTRVEVNGIGDDQWSFSALHFQLGFTF